MPATIEILAAKRYNDAKVQKRVLYNGITSPFQGEVTGSTPVTRSTTKYKNFRHLKND